MRIEDLKINGISNPIGYTYDGLLCSWKVHDTESRKQEKAEIEVSIDPQFLNIVWKKEGADLCQSGEKIDFIPKARTRYYYRVSVTGDHGDYAEAQGIFETGKMGETWKAEWISPSREDKFHPVMRKVFVTDRKVTCARLYASGVGVFEPYLNGNKIGKEYLAPYINNYETNIQVLTFPAEAFLKEQGENCLEFILGKGWYMGTFGLEGEEENYGNRMAVIAELHIIYEDGETEVICTDGSWEYRGSDIQDSGIYFGEILNRELWDGRDNSWRPAEVISDPAADEGTKNLLKTHLMDRLSLPVIVKETVEVKEIIETPSGEIVLDMGQNFAGYLEFDAQFPKGTKIVLDFGEILQNGEFYRENYREAKSQFVYVSGGKAETVRPHFTFFGFRYVRVNGWPRDIRKEQFRGRVLYSDIERTGFLHTGNPKIDRLYENTLWGLKSNFIDIPTDCPQRNERLGWTGDAQVFAPTASYHMDTRAFFHKFIKDLKDEQEILGGAVPNYVPNIGHKDDATSVWGDIAAFLPYVLYRHFGSREEMKYCYPLMKNWVDYIDRKDEMREEKQYTPAFGFQFGDWLALDGPTPTSFKGSTDDTYIGAMYYCESVRRVKEIAEVLGYEEDAAHYKELEEKIRTAILNEYFTPNGKLAADTQASYIIALKFGICVDKKRTIRELKERLKKDRNEIRCGFVGAPLLCSVLAEAGEYDLAYEILLNEEFPGWLYAVNLGATTVWERWNSVLPDGTISGTGMNSLNHYAYGSVMEFMYAYAAGIRPLEPGFKRAVIEPHPDVRLPKIECRYDSVSGMYFCGSEISVDGKLKIKIEVPFNCEAKVKLPDYPGEDGECTLQAGIYEFDYIPTRDYRRPYGEYTVLARIGRDKGAVEILEKYVPVLAQMAVHKDPEFGFHTLGQMRYLSFLPFAEEDLDRAIKELEEYAVI